MQSLNSDGVENRFQCAMSRIDLANREDPNQEFVGGTAYPREWLYSQRMTTWLNKLVPDASETLQLAVRAQHIARWTIPRNTYPLDREGYHRWRSDLARFHAEMTGAILEECGYDLATISRVGSLLRKERLKADPEAQTLEDVACLVFLESYFADFARKHEDEELVRILSRTWKKMSERGRQAALSLPLTPEARSLVVRAVAGEQTVSEGRDAAAARQQSPRKS